MEVIVSFESPPLWCCESRPMWVVFRAGGLTECQNRRSGGQIYGVYCVSSVLGRDTRRVWYLTLNRFKSWKIMDSDPGFVRLLLITNTASQTLQLNPVCAVAPSFFIFISSCLWLPQVSSCLSLTYYGKKSFFIKVYQGVVNKGWCSRWSSYYTISGSQLFEPITILSHSLVFPSQQIGCRVRNAESAFIVTRLGS